MFAQKQLNDLAERRRQLVLETDLYRSLIVLEREHLRSKLAWIDQAREKVASVASAASGSPWVKVGGTLAGLLAVRHWQKVIRWAPIGLAAMRWMKSLKAK